jgi:hypothetical protein
MLDEHEASVATSRVPNVNALLLDAHGASLQPYRVESPPPLLAKSPLLPRHDPTGTTLAEDLPLPVGLAFEPRAGARPQSVLEARITFTLLARELGSHYREARGVPLSADVSGIESIQTALLEAFPDRTLRSPTDIDELHRHGALLSEILARHLDAEWVDISPKDLGFWSMIVPPDTRIWPFGRIARFVERGHRERDLVSYFFELQARAKGR